MIPGESTMRVRAGWMAAALAAAVLPYVVLAVYAYPSADDYDYAMDTRIDGYWTAFARQYSGWNGRFASNVLVLANPMVVGSIGLYRIVAVAMFAVTLAAMYAFVRAIAGSAFERRTAAMCALGWCGVYVAAVPALPENFYWYTGAVTYQLSSALLIAQAALFLAALRRRGGGLHAALPALPLLFIVGMNEIVMLLAIAGYAVFAALARRRGDHRAATAALACLAAAAIGGVAVALSPGNAVRGALYPARHELVRSLAITIAQTVRFGAAWATSGALLLATILFVPLARRIAAVHPFWRDLSRGELVVLVAAPFVVIPFGIFPAVWSTGMLGQHRTVSVAFSAFVALWFVASIAVVARMPPVAASAPARLRLAAAIALAAAVAFTGNGYAVTTDLVTGRARRFADAMEARSAALAACGHTPARPCRIDGLTDSLRGLSVASGSTDAAWAIQSHARYFGVPLFELEPAPSDVRH